MLARMTPQRHSAITWMPLFKFRKSTDGVATEEELVAAALLGMLWDWLLICLLFTLVLLSFSNLLFLMLLHMTLTTVWQ